MVQGSPERDRRLRSGVCRPPRAARVKDGSVKSRDLSQWQAEVMDVDAEREKIAKEIAELERILDPTSSGIGVGVSESGLTLDSDAGELSQATAGTRPSALQTNGVLGRADLCLDSPRRPVGAPPQLAADLLAVSALSPEAGGLSSGVRRFQSSACPLPPCWTAERHPHVLSSVLPWP